MCFFSQLRMLKKESLYLGEGAVVPFLLERGISGAWLIA